MAGATRYHERPYAMPQIHINDLEAAINFWRARAPVGAGMALCPELLVLAEVYAQAALTHALWVDVAQWPNGATQAWEAWYATTMDTPCIAICSTSQGDDWCKGCGRSFAEVQHWLAMTPVEKRVVWHRITQQGTALRFTRYRERAGR